MKKIIVWMTLVVASLGVAFGETRLTGTVTDELGGMIPGAMALIHWDPAGSTVGLSSNVGIRKDLVLTADKEGNFIADLPPGFYDLFVSAAAFTPKCRKIRLNSRPSVATFRLALDPLVQKEIGDKFR